MRPDGRTPCTNDGSQASVMDQMRHGLKNFPDDPIFTAVLEGRVSEVFISVLPVEITDGAAIIDGRYRLSASVGQIRGEYKEFNDVSLERSWKTNGYTRICVDAEGVDEIEITIEII